MFKSEMDVQTATLSGETRTVLLQLVELYTVYWALEKVGDLLLVSTTKAVLVWCHNKDNNMFIVIIISLYTSHCWE